MPTSRRPEHTGHVEPGPFGPPTPPSTTDQRVRPSLVWFWVAGAIALVGIIAGVVMIVRGITGYESAIEDFDRADLPATLEVEISETGGYSIYHEYDGAYDEIFATPPEVTVTDPSGDDVPLDDYDTSVTYSADGHEGDQHRHSATRPCPCCLHVASVRGDVPARKSPASAGAGTSGSSGLSA